eukprot:3366427-Pleurochrysis_carterae.AAC.1
MLSRAQHRRARWCGDRTIPRLGVLSRTSRPELEQARRLDARVSTISSFVTLHESVPVREKRTCAFAYPCGLI